MSPKNRTSPFRSPSATATEIYNFDVSSPTKSSLSFSMVRPRLSLGLGAGPSGAIPVSCLLRGRVTGVNFRAVAPKRSGAAEPEFAERFKRLVFPQARFSCCNCLPENFPRLPGRATFAARTYGLSGSVLRKPAVPRQGCTSACKYPFYELLTLTVKWPGKDNEVGCRTRWLA